MTGLIDTLVGLAALARLALRTGGRVSGANAHPYWRWRHDTAEGTGPDRARLRRGHALIEYARWVGRMRRLR